MCTDGRLAGDTGLGPVLEQVALSARWRDLQAETLDVGIPQDVFAAHGLGRVDCALCEAYWIVSPRRLGHRLPYKDRDHIGTTVIHIAAEYRKRGNPRKVRFPSVP